MDPEKPKDGERADDFETVRLDRTSLAFNRYRLLSELGRGGSGVVWLARDLELNTNVALKFLRDDVAGETDALRELKGEIILNRDLTHPYIIKTYNFETNGQKSAIAMEYVSGDNLEKLKSRRPEKCFNVEDIGRWMHKLCDALHYAHQQNVVHRDIKPSNLMINQQGELKVGDFGIGRTMAETVNRITNSAAGTPPYMSPQQAMGEKAVRSDDIYSIGATIYDLLTGAPPFFRGAILEQTLHKVPPPMAERRRELGRNGTPIPREWEDAVAACLFKTPEARPPTARSVGEMLRGATATSIMYGYPIAKEKTSKIVKWTVAGAAAVAAYGGFLFWRSPQRDEWINEAVAYVRPPPAERSVEPRVLPPPPAKTPTPEVVERPKQQFTLFRRQDAATDKQHPAASRISSMVEATAIDVQEAEWLLTAVKGEKGEGERSLATRLIETNLITPGQWRARTTFDYTLGSDVRLNTQQLPLAIDLPVGESIKTRLLRIDTGTFVRGSPKEELGRRPNELPPERRSISKPFYIGVFEVTQAEFRALMPRDPSFWRGNPNWPTDQVDWDAVSGSNGYIARLNLLLAGRHGGTLVADLPTEDEWEYACRAGSTSAFGNGVDISALDRDRGLDALANYNQPSHGTPRPVGSFLPNTWGLYDMHGNVAEWCQDRFQRGGSWHSRAASCRSAWRIQISSFAPPSNQVGFRLVLRHQARTQDQ